MAIKPILFNTEMVRAILDGRKTCTRRVIKLPENMDGVPVGKSGDSNNPLGFMHPGGIKRPPYQPGDILYVRETWCELPVNEAGHMRGHPVYYYRADGDLRPEGWRGKWRPSIHMPKEAARIWLKVTNVRVERLQEITIDGIRNEGISSMAVHAGDMEIALKEWKNLWNSTIKKTGLDSYGWEANPWVWVIEFERCEKPEGV
jgi:hypothetical protein